MANTLLSQFCQASLHLDKIVETWAKHGSAAGTLAASYEKKYTTIDFHKIFYYLALNSNFDFMIAVEKINDIVSRIAKKFNPEKIILFGSYAIGNQNDNSDIDLLVIKESDQPIQYRDFEIRKYLIGTSIPMDILVYTNAEYEHEMTDIHSFISSTLKTSKVVYER